MRHPVFRSFDFAKRLRFELPPVLPGLWGGHNEKGLRGSLHGGKSLRGAKQCESYGRSLQPISGTSSDGDLGIKGRHPHRSRLDTVDHRECMRSDHLRRQRAWIDLRNALEPFMKLGRNANLQRWIRHALRLPVASELPARREQRCHARWPRRMDPVEEVPALTVLVVQAALFDEAVAFIGDRQAVEVKRGLVVKVHVEALANPASPNVDNDGRPVVGGSMRKEVHAVLLLEAIDGALRVPVGSSHAVLWHVVPMGLRRSVVDAYALHGDIFMVERRPARRPRRCWLYARLPRW